MRALVSSERSSLRLARARAFLEGLAPDAEAWLLGPSVEPLSELLRSLRRPVFGWRRATLFRAALELATPALVARGLAVAPPLTLEALWARVTHALADRAALARLLPLAERPGLPRALARTVHELRMLRVAPEGLEPALGQAMRAFEAALAEARLVDRAQVYALACEAPAPQVPLLLLDLSVAPGLEADLVTRLARAAPRVLATAPAEDAHLEAALGVRREHLPVPQGTALGALQANLFTARQPEAPRPFEELFSAPGEARECVEIARRVQEAARAGVPFDRMAVLLRSPATYRGPLEEALRRAGVPAWFDAGLPRPDPSGRALLALLLCREEGLSARRFGEYLSLAQVPRPDAAPRAPFAPAHAAESLVPELETAPGEAQAEALEAPDSAVVAGHVRSPRRWERLLVDAAVIGGVGRWRRRLAGLAAQTRRALEDPALSEAHRGRLERQQQDLEALTAFALPVLEDLAALPDEAPWSRWLEALSALAGRVLKAPTRVLSVLAELAPLGPVGPVSLREVRAVVARRLAEVTTPPEGRRSGHVFVAPVEAARGLAFEVVFVPGLAERIFPQKLREDPLLPDAARARCSPHLEVMAGRVAAERRALQLAVGAATARAVLSFPRLDGDQARPRVPSFYALEAVRAVEGHLPGFEALQRAAEASGEARLAWPAPSSPERAIDEAEFDLSLLGRLLRSDGPHRGRARYLVEANPHLARALRARFARWQQSAWTPWDGLVKPSARGREALAPHQLSARPYSPTALEQYAACPYRFYLSAVARLAPLEAPEALEALGPLERGSLAHEIQFRLLSALRDEAVAVTQATLPQVFARLDETLRAVSEEVYDALQPAIERVWRDGLEALRADLREWLRRTAEEPRWTPWRFELSFGLPGRAQQDPASAPEPVTLPQGLRVRGSIDLVERAPSGAVRATDYKTGSVHAAPGNVIGGGRHLQPALYALVLEQLLPEARVEGGRLYYCTQAGGFTEIATPLDARSREAMGLVATTLREALETGFFPAAPEEDGCRWCDFRAVCGAEEPRRLRVTRKALRPETRPLLTLRSQP